MTEKQIFHRRCC